MKLYRIIFFFFFIILLLPGVQLCTSVFRVKPLKGWFKEYKLPEFSLQSWFRGEFQTNFDKYYENHIGFRPPLVRIRNQLSYTINKEAKAAGVVIGKEMYLYEKNYIEAFNGIDFLGAKTIKSVVDSLQMIRNQLKQYNSDILICFAAGKGSYFPEYFPDEYSVKDIDSTNYMVYKTKFLEYEFPVIDFNSWFLTMKDTAHTLLYPKYGIHWSEYGAVLVADSLLKYIEELKDCNLPEIEITQIEYSETPRGSDYDMGESLNLLFKLPGPEMAYPKIRWNSDPQVDSLKVIVISDSFYWQLHGMGVSKKAFSDAGFWYYNKVHHPGSIPIEEVDVSRKLSESDLVIIIATEATLRKFPFNFHKDAFSALNISE